MHAEAICEVVTRLNMWFVATKTRQQESRLTPHRTRHLFIRQQTSVINVIRAHLAEFGIVAPVGRNYAQQLLGIVADAADKRLPDVARACVAALGVQLRMLKALDFAVRSARSALGIDPARKACGSTIYLGVGPAFLIALVATVADPRAFRSGCNFLPGSGIVPKQHSSGRGGWSGQHLRKRGDRYLRGLFVVGALAVICYG